MAKRSGPRTRIEKDTMGEMRVPASALWGAQTARAVENFPISGLRAHPAFVDATVRVKLAAARANARLGLLPRTKARAIEAAAREVLAGRWRDQFVVDVYQAGAGTSHNMNVNEVLANRATELLGGRRGAERLVDPERRREHGAVHERRGADRDPARRARARAGGHRRALRARADVRGEGAALGRDREVRPDAPHGRDADPARPGGVGLGGRALRRGGARPRRAPRALAARDRRHGGRHRAQRPPALPGARRRGAGAAHRRPAHARAEPLLRDAVARARSSRSPARSEPPRSSSSGSAATCGSSGAAPTPASASCASRRCSRAPRSCRGR